MTPYYEQDGITIYHGDCREILPQLSADTLVTDPVWPGASIPLVGSDRPEALFDEMVAALPPLIKRAAVQLGCDTPPFFVRSVPLPFFRVAWLELVRVGYKGRLLMTGDVAYLFGAPPPSRPGAHVIPGRFIDPSCDGPQTAHPCPRKLGHVQWLVKWWSAPDDIIIDPFVGSGTTLVAAKKLGHLAIGIEVEERWCEVAAKRLSQSILPLEMGA